MDEKLMEKIRPGAMVTVVEIIRDGEKQRQSNFKGLVIARKHGSQKGAMFTVRAMVDGIAVEKMYPLHSPMIADVKINSTPKNIHKAKLYFVRGISKKKMQKRLGVSI